MIKSLCILGLSFLTAYPAVLAQSPAESRSADEKALIVALARKRVTVNFQETSLKEAAAFLARAGEVNIVVDPYVLDVFESEGRRVSLQLTDLTLLDTLNVFVRFNHLTWTVRNRVVFISMPDRIRGKAVLRLFDVRNLARGFRDERAVVSDLFRQYARDFQEQTQVYEEAEHIQIEDLVDCIRESVAPETWDAGEYRVSCVAGHLLVSHTESVHREIESLLQDFRSGIHGEVLVKIKVLRLPWTALAAIPRGQILSSKAFAGLVKAAGGSRQPFGGYRVLSMNGCRAHVRSGRPFIFKKRMVEGEPESMEAWAGALLDVRPMASDGRGVACTVRYHLSKLRTNAFEHPRLPFLAGQTVATLPRNGAILLATGPAADFEAKEAAPDAALALFLEAASLSVAAAPAKPGRVEPKDVKVRGILERWRETVEFEETPLDVVVDFLAKRAGINILVDPAVYEENSEDELMVSLRVRDLPLRDLLTLITEPMELGFYVADGVVQLSTREGCVDSAVFKTFGVADLLGAAEDAEPTTVERFHQGQWGEEPVMEYEEEPLTGDTLVNMIRETIDIESWDTPPNQIHFRLGELMLRNRPEVIEEAAALLDSIRDRLWKRVEVTGAFLSVPPGWADALGFRGPVLTPAQCEMVEGKLAGGAVSVKARFSTLTTPGRKFSVSGGRQVVEMRDYIDPGKWDSDVILDGFHFEGTVFTGLTEDEVGLSLSAYCSNYLESNQPDSKAGELADQRFRTDMRAPAGGGALIGASSKGTGGTGEWLLYLRVR
ncbi:MAG: hypothetical protein ACYS47_15325 [Planctomycetota bacterium]|jgi:hypothetical protein